MPMMKDPVCGMVVDFETAEERASYEGRTFVFCSSECRKSFSADPAKFAGAVRPEEPRDLERHEPPRTTTGPLTAPKFGSAGSGGAEYERLPEAHDEP
jgi:YHS domain-containing protein